MVVAVGDKLLQPRSSRVYGRSCMDGIVDYPEHHPHPKLYYQYDE
jgi:hypothetical protein